MYKNVPGGVNKIWQGGGELQKYDWVVRGKNQMYGGVHEKMKCVGGVRDFFQSVPL